MDLESSSSLKPAGLSLVATAATNASAPSEDAALMMRYARGDVRAFEMLYARHKGGVYRYLRRMCPGSAADDLFQEVWSRVIASRERYQPTAQFNTFLYRIAHNCAVDHLRKSGREQTSSNVEELAQGLPDAAHRTPDAALAQAQVRSAFRRALDGLPAEQRDVFLLYEESGLDLNEIGRITGVAMDTAKSRLRYAVAKLRAALAPHHTSDPLKSVTP